MKSFKDFGIKPTKQHFVGDKIKIVKVLNKQIVVSNYKIEASKYPKNKSGNVMTLQVIIDGVSSIIFTGSDFLMDQIAQVPESDMPFTTTIVKNGEHFEFS
ncbi:MAG: hypothetical protein KGZ82_10575 [Bacteroidales bacterium]|nr:hypothetical protein [Bacteroidales bacterium]